MLFKELSGILNKGDTVTLTLAIESAGQLRVNLYPKLFTMDGEKGEDRQALNQPLTVTGTAEELDSPEFVATLQKYTASITGLRSTLDEAETTHKAAADKSKPKPGAAKPTVGKPVTGGGTKKPVIAAKPAAKPTPAKLPNRPAAGKNQPPKPAVVVAPPAPAPAGAPASGPAPMESSGTLAETKTATEILDEHIESAEAGLEAEAAAPEEPSVTLVKAPTNAIEATEELI